MSLANDVLIETEFRFAHTAWCSEFNVNVTL